VPEPTLPEPDEPALPEAEGPALPEPVVLPPFELPTARQVVGRGLQLALDASADIRRASIYVGLLVFALAGPFVLVLIAYLPRLSGISFDDPQSMSPADAAAFLSVVGSLFLLGMIAATGLITVSIDGAIIAVTLLGARAVGRPMRLREGLARARQVFWRYGAAAFVVGIVGEIAVITVQLQSGAFDPSKGPPSTGSQLLAVFLGTLVEAPFGYVQAAIILGDVDAATSLRRSVALARARPRLAAAVAGFAFLASALQTFGLGVALDLATRIGTFLHPSFETQGWGILLAVPPVAAGLIAFGSLGLTVNAIVAAPQVAAFLGLTHFSAGLEKARLPAPEAAPVATYVPGWAREAAATEDVAPGATDLAPAAETAAEAAVEPTPAPRTSHWVSPGNEPGRPVQWVTLPMAGLIALGVLFGVVGLVQPAPPARSSDPMIRALEIAAGPGITMSGAATEMSDPFGDPAGGKWGEADLTAGEYALVPVVPAWVLTGFLNCALPPVSCGQYQGDGAFDGGALLVTVQVAATPEYLPYSGDGTVGEWGGLFTLPDGDAAPSGDDSYALASVAYVVRLGNSLTPNQFDIHRLTWDGARFVDRPSAARGILIDDTFLILIPRRSELPSLPTRWDAFASVSGQGATTYVVTRDWLRPHRDALLEFEPPPTVTFPGAPSY
jgi:hypothetical protein